MSGQLGRRQLSRRSLLTLATGAVSLAGGGVLAACGGSAAVSTSATSSAAAAPTTATASTAASVSTAASRASQPATTTTSAPTSVASSASASATASVAASSQAPAGAGVTIRFAMYTFQPWNDRLNTLFASYAKDHPGVKPEQDVIATDIWTKLQTQALAGTSPDLSIMDPSVFVQYADRGYLQSLDALVAQDKLDLSQWYPETVDDGRYTKGSLGFGQGTLYAMPETNVGMVIYYNKTLFARDGVPEPINDWTWDQFLQAAQKLTHRDQQVPQFGVVGATGPKNMDGFLFSAGGDYMNDAGTQGALSSAPSQSALTWLADLVQKYRVQPTDDEIKNVKNGFQNGRWAMEVNGTWNVDTYVQQITAYEWDLAPVPVGPAGASGRRTYIGTNTLSMYAATKHRAEAWDVLKFLVGEQAMQLFAETGTPCLIKVAQSDAFIKPNGKPAHRKVMADLPTYGKNLYREAGSNYWVGDVGKALTPLWQGKTDAKTAGSQADTAISVGLDKAKAEAQGAK